ncbi:MAG: flagellar export chaperone FliS [Planctomycetota bacterium]
MTTNPQAKKYLENQVATASPEQLVIMLYDGALRFLSQGREQMVAGQTLESHALLVKAQRIIIELMCALNPDADKTLSDNLTSLYFYMYQQLIRANIEKDVKRVEEVTKLMETLRGGWREAVALVRGEHPPTGTGPIPPSSDSRLSLQG